MAKLVYLRDIGVQADPAIVDRHVLRFAEPLIITATSI